MSSDRRRLVGLVVCVVFALVFAEVVTRTGETEIVLLGLFTLAALAANAYVFFYWFRPWRSTRQGEALMVKGWGNAILLNLGFATLAFGEDYWGRDYFRVLGLTAFTVGIAYLLVSLLTSPGAEAYPPRTWLCWLRSRFSRHN